MHARDSFKLPLPLAPPSRIPLFFSPLSILSILSSCPLPTHSLTPTLPPPPCSVAFIIMNHELVLIFHDVGGGGYAYRVAQECSLLSGRTSWDKGKTSRTRAICKIILRHTLSSPHRNCGVPCSIVKTVDVISCDISHKRKDRFIFCIFSMWRRFFCNFLNYSSKDLYSYHFISFSHFCHVVELALQGK